MNQKEMYEKLGETMMFCQCIENDVKLIYAYMLAGDTAEIYENIKRNTLGQITQKLQELDNSDNNPLLSDLDYSVIRKITEERNYFMHTAFKDYLYDRGKLQSINFEKVCARLVNFNNSLAKLYKVIEQIRVDFFN